MKMSDIKYGLFKYEVKDYHSILGVPIDASAKEIRLRYLKIAYQLHPDTCRAETAEEKEKASIILSKLVNPAYENLYKDKLRKECQLILSEIGRRLATDAYQITIVTDSAKKLFQEEQDLEKLYHEMIEKIVPDLYLEVDKIPKKIALISELNMVYLMRKKEREHKETISDFASSYSSSPSSSVQTSEPIITQASPNDTQDDVTSSPTTQDDSQPLPQEEESTGSLGHSVTAKIQRLINSAQQHQENGNLEQGVLDLREALKLDPNNSTCHALIGSLYLKQGNISYARIHIKKGADLNPDDPIVKRSKQELKEAKADNKSSSGQKGKSASSKAQKSSKSAGKSKGEDQKGKKEPPKIFGIPLW